MQGQEPPPSDNLFVGELPDGIQDATVRQLFGQYGTVTDLRILPGNASGTAAALIRFAHEEEAIWIVNNVNGNIPEGLSSPVVVRYANSRGAGKGGAKGGAAMHQQMPAATAVAPQGCAVTVNVAASQYHPDDVRYNPYGAQQQAAAAPAWNATPEPAWGEGGWGGKGWSEKGWSEKGWSEKGWSEKGKGGGKDKGKGKKGIKELIFRFGSAGVLPGGAKWQNDENTVFVGGLPFDTTDTDLYCLFSPFGAVAPRGIKAMINRDNGECTGIGFVNFLDALAAQTAVQSLDGQPTPAGPPLRVSIKKPKQAGDQGGGWSQQYSDDADAAAGAQAEQSANDAAAAQAYG